MANGLYLSVQKFVQSNGQDPLFLENGFALKADKKPDRYGQVAIRLWRTQGRSLAYAEMVLTYISVKRHPLRDKLQMADVMLLVETYGRKRKSQRAKNRKLIDDVILMEAMQHD